MTAVECEFCGLSIEPAAAGTYQFTTGWAKQRTAGGTNQVSLPKRQHRFACRPCIDIMTRGEQTESLFDL